VIRRFLSLGGLAAGIVAMAAVTGVAQAAPRAAAPSTAMHAGAGAAQSPQSARGALNYRITFHTGDRSSAGTDGDIYLKLYGNKDGAGTSSPWLYLDDSSDNWERNKYDVFDRYLTDVGTITRACVYFNDHGGDYSDWYLDWVTVNGTFFQYYRWFTRTESVCRSAS
jgi:hypothetical protein